MPGGGEEMRAAKGSLEGTAMRVSGVEVETESLGLGALIGVGSRRVSVVRAAVQSCSAGVGRIGEEN